MKRLVIPVAAALLAGCALSYKPISPQASYYPNANNYSGVELSYRQGVLRETGNKKYARHEDKKDVRVFTVKLVNNTNTPLVVGEDVLFYTGNTQAILLDPHTAVRELKQVAPFYLFYLLLTPIDLYHTSNPLEEPEVTPIGFFVGPAVSIGNMVVAGEANKDFYHELDQCNIAGKTLAPGQTVYGIISFRDDGYNPISIKLSEATTN